MGAGHRENLRLLYRQIFELKCQFWRFSGRAEGFGNLGASNGSLGQDANASRTPLGLSDQAVASVQGQSAKNGSAALCNSERNASECVSSANGALADDRVANRSVTVPHMVSLHLPVGDGRGQSAHASLSASRCLSERIAKVGEFGRIDIGNRPVFQPAGDPSHHAVAFMAGGGGCR